jgi:Ras-related GTP-binding protein A/B
MAAEQRKKVLLMGKSGSGKTSMRSIIFANYLARDTQRLNPTLDVQHSSVRFLGSLVLNLWDCGGQDAFYESYFVSRREHIFRNVAVLIYVFDVTSADFERDLDYYGGTVEALAQFSPDARVFALVHKCDLLPDGAQARVAEERALAIRARSFAFAPSVYRTSIWDETLYKAWSSVVHALIPNVATLEAKLAALAGGCDADEAVLFERSSFLVISSVSRRTHPDVHRYEKISNIVKQFKLACSCVTAAGLGVAALGGRAVGDARTPWFAPSSCAVVAPLLHAPAGSPSRSWRAYGWATRTTACSLTPSRPRRTCWWSRRRSPRRRRQLPSRRRPPRVATMTARGSSPPRWQRRQQRPPPRRRCRPRWWRSPPTRRRC